jgi:hypothetical protein
LGGLPDRVRRWAAGIRRPDLLPGFSLAARPGLLTLTALLLIALCAALSFSARRGREPGISLLGEAASSKLNSTSAETPASPAPASQPEPERLNLGAHEPSLPAVVADSSVVPAVSKTMPILADAAPVLEPAPSATQQARAWEKGYENRNFHQGDTPMNRTWKSFGQALLAATLAAGPAAAQGTAPTSDTLKAPDPAALSKDIQELKKDVADMKRSMVAVDADTNKRLQRIEDDGKNGNLSVNRALEQLDELKRQVARMQLDLDALKNRPAPAATPNQTALYPPQTPSAPVGTPASGRVRLVNSFYEPMTVVVNNKAYNLPPGDSRYTEPLAAGNFTYEILGVQPAQARQLAPNETFTVTIYPR